MVDRQPGGCRRTRGWEFGVADTVRSDIQTREQFAHEAVFYDGAAETRAGVLPFIRAGVEAEEPVLVALLPDAVTEVRDELGDTGRAIRSSTWPTSAPTRPASSRPGDSS